MKKLVAVLLALNAVLVAGLCWKELVVHAGGGAFGGNGDMNGDGEINVTDVINLLNWMFLGGNPPVACADSPELLERVTNLEGQMADIQAANDDLKSTCNDLRNRVMALEGLPVITPEQNEILSKISMVDLPDGQGGTTRTIRISGVNVQVVNGLGNTRFANGAGNLIVGYNELRTRVDAVNDRRGSHNLVAGDWNNYTDNAFGGLVVGENNTIAGNFSSVSGGSGNTASGYQSSVSGGIGNTASGFTSSVSGGATNTASNDFSSVSGGRNNTAWENSSSVSGGCNVNVFDGCGHFP